MSSEPLFSAEPPRREGMSGSTKILLGLGLGCGLLMIVACGGVAAFVYWFQGWVAKSSSTDPATVRRLTGEIVTMEIPARLEPNLSFDAKMPGTEAPLGVVVVYADKSKDSTLILMEWRASLSEQQREQLQRSFQDSIERQGHQRHAVRIEQKPKTHETTIHGKPAKFLLSRGVRESDEKEMWQVTGEFDGLEGPAILIFSALTDDYSEEEITAMLDSMK